MSSNAGVQVSIADGIQIIKFVNAKKRNAISNTAYEIISQALEEASEDPSVVLTVFTGDGSYYSSGFDITSTTDSMDDEVLKVRLNKLKKFIASMVDYPKLMIALVNGPAIGIAVTTAAICDIIYASDNATFRTPFTNLGLCAEGCSSYTFPRILGKSKANEMLLLNHQMSAQEAYQFGFVAEVFKHDELSNAWEKIKGFAKLPVNSIMITKKLCQKFDHTKLHEANDMEIKYLEERFMSEDFVNAMVMFLTKKSKL